MLANLLLGLHMGAGEGGAAVVFVAPIGKKKGILRPDGPDHNPVGLSGHTA